MQSWAALVGAVGTVVAAIGTVSAVWIALSTATEEKTRRAEREERVQATLVSAWIDDEGISGPDSAEQYARFIINNDSQQVIYTVVANISQLFADGSADCVESLNDQFQIRIAHVPPGRYWTLIQHPGPGMNRRFGIDYAFMDTAGISWHRNAIGKLERFRKAPLEVYGVSLPTSWSDIFPAVSLT